jgi:hypothetical protein
MQFKEITMGLNIIARGGVAPMNAPVFGNLLHTDAMRLALRPTSSNNAFDLSVDEWPLNVNGSPLFTPNGMLISGSGGLEAAGLKLADKNSYTILAVLSASNLSLTDNNNKNIAVTGDYLPGNASSMLYVLPSGGVPAVSMTFGGYNTTTSAVANATRSAAIPSSYITNNSDGTYNIKPIFIAAHLSIDSGDSGAQRIFIPSTQAAPLYENVFSVSATPTKFDRTSKALGQAGGVQNVKIGYYTGGTVASNKTIKCSRVDSVALTQQQIQDQYQSTKKWLAAEGVLNIAHWA